MRQSIRALLGLLFLAGTVALITLVHINPVITAPAKSTQVRDAGIFTGLVPGVVIVQEFKAEKDYLTGVDVFFTHRGKYNTSENTLFLLDAGYQVITRVNFSSTIVPEGDLTPLRFAKPVFIGRGKLVRLCLTSHDGTEGNSIHPLLNMNDSIGDCFISSVTGEDWIGAVKSPLRHFHGSMMIRTFETGSSQFWLLKGLLYLVVVVFSCLIIWFAQIRAWLARSRIRAEWVFLIIALPAALVFAFITPPLQVPDEGNHFLKSYKIAEFNFSRQPYSAPASLVELDSAFVHLHFFAGKKTASDVILSHLGDPLQAARKVAVSPPEYTLPYLPQATGIFFGKILHTSPLVMMYLGRLFNLLISIVILFFAIRIIPEFKWILVLLALMPKTVFLLGSLSYDSLTISLSFLTLAVFLYYAFGAIQKLGWKELAVMGGLVLLLLLCKPPYFLLGLLFFFIPPRKFGALYKYLMIGIGVVFLAGVIFITWSRVSQSFQASGSTAPQEVSASSESSPDDLPLIRPGEQMHNITKDVPGYIRMIFHSAFVLHRHYFFNSFVGYLGWVDVELPELLTWIYFLFLFTAGLFLYEGKVRLNIPHRLLLAAMLFATFLVVETAMYLYATRPGRNEVFGVQGRYFIPMAPLVFMLFYNQLISTRLNLVFSLRRKEYRQAKPKGKPTILQEVQENEQLFNKFFYLALTCFTVFTLVYSIYITLVRYYNF
ncbi:MAG TPA: DUF2142 domain-containing protein [Bacteroidales bacterium]|nr:DUF2142 domain-containing protein [Bacteroidales bacterium]